MKRNKHGFTLAEVLICLVVIGVIMAISVQTIKIVRASYTSLAYFEFLNIQRMAGEMIAGATPEILKDAKGMNIGFPTTSKKSPEGISYTTITDDSTVFCKFITSLSNTVGTNGDNECISLFNVTEDTEPRLIILDKEEDKGEGSAWDNPTFISSSGRRYYISNYVEMGSSVSDKHGYYIIAVDLNGTQGPNTTEYDGRKVPDIVNFMILDNGEVFPLGVAADNIKLDKGINQEINGKKVKERTVVYINSKVKGFYFGHDDARTTSPRECTIKGSAGGKRCNFGVIYAPNQNATGQSFFFSYREAYCSTLGTRESAYADYCAGQPYHTLCPPSDDEKSFDVCRVENIKPAFRYNF